MLDWLKEKTSPKALFGEGSLFSNAIMYGTAGFYTGIYTASENFAKDKLGMKDSSPSVIQGIPNWALGVGIVYLAMRK